MPPLMLLAGTLLPEILKIFASDKSDSIGNKVTDVFKNVLQTEDKDTAQQKLESNAIDKAKVQLELAKIAAEVAAEEHRADEERKSFELEVLQDQIAESERARQVEFHRYDLDAQDRNIARNRQSHLEDEESVFAYVAPTLALLITTGLGYFMYLLLNNNTEIQNKDVFNNILGAVTTAFVAIVTFYFGSSVGSKEKVDLSRAVSSRSATTLEARLPKLLSMVENLLMVKIHLRPVRINLGHPNHQLIPDRNQNCQRRLVRMPPFARRPLRLLPFL